MAEQRLYRSSGMASVGNLSAQWVIFSTESESESEIFYLTIIHVQFIIKVIHLINPNVKDDFC